MRSLSKLLLLALAGSCITAIAADPGVDIAWKVLPRRVAADSFGSRIAKLYYAVVAVVGNNSGYDLQVSSVFFRLPARDALTAPIPADPYRIVRGSLERERLVGLRNTAINALKGVGPVLSGAAVFYAGTSAMSIARGRRYSEIVNLITNPFEKGLEIAFPDKTLNQMVALENQALRDAAIIPDNSQQTLVVFVSRDLLMPPKDGAAETEAKRRAMRGRFKGEFDTMLVMRELGDLVLTGKSVQYVNRISVSATSGKPVSAPEK
jgi:hypothetical protein